VLTASFQLLQQLVVLVLSFTLVQRRGKIISPDLIEDDPVGIFYAPFALHSPVFCFEWDMLKLKTQVTHV
jgi:hypothetical protein